MVLDAVSRAKLSIGRRENLLGRWLRNIFFDTAKCGGKCMLTALHRLVVAFDVPRSHITALALDLRPVQVLRRHVLADPLYIFLVLLLAAVEADDHAIDVDGGKVVPDLHLTLIRDNIALKGIRGRRHIRLLHLFEKAAQPRMLIAVKLRGAILPALEPPLRLVGKVHVRILRHI